MQISRCFEENIFKFEISVNDASDMTVVHRVDDLEYDPSRFYLRHSSFLFNPLIKLTSSGTLHDHDELFLLNKCVIELNDVFVLEFLQGFGLLVDVLNHVSGLH
jgi:hypothetical protein